MDVTGQQHRRPHRCAENVLAVGRDDDEIKQRRRVECEPFYPTSNVSVHLCIRPSTRTEQREGQKLRRAKTCACEGAEPRTRSAESWATPAQYVQPGALPSWMGDH